MPVAQVVGPAGRRRWKQTFLRTGIGACSDRCPSSPLSGLDQFLVGSLELAGPGTPPSPGESIVYRRQITRFGHLRRRRPPRSPPLPEGRGPHRALGSINPGRTKRTLFVEDATPRIDDGPFPEGGLRAWRVVHKGAAATLTVPKSAVRTHPTSRGSLTKN